jgi:hypothetical protein
MGEGRSPLVNTTHSAPSAFRRGPGKGRQQGRLLGFGWGGFRFLRPRRWWVRGDQRRPRGDGPVDELLAREERRGPPTGGLAETRIVRDDCDARGMHPGREQLLDLIIRGPAAGESNPYAPVVRLLGVMGCVHGIEDDPNGRASSLGRIGKPVEEPSPCLAECTGRQPSPRESGRVHQIVAVNEEVHGRTAVTGCPGVWRCSQPTVYR